MFNHQKHTMSCYCRGQDTKLASPLFSSCCYVFGFLRGWPTVCPTPHLVKAPPATALPIRNLKAIALLLASSQLSVLKEQEERQTPGQLHETQSCHFFHQACLKTSPLPQGPLPISLRTFLSQGSLLLYGTVPWQS